MTISNKNQEKGFTLIELMMATAVFSVVMLIVTTGIIRIGQIYYRNITQNRTSEATRVISEEIVRSIQFAKGNRRAGADPATQFCIGDTRYTYNINQKVTGGTPGLISERISPSDACSSAASINTQELLGENMRLLAFDVNPVDAAERTWRVNVRVAYGDDDLLSHYNDNGTPVNPASVNTDAANADCKSGIAGGSFCATARLDTTVKKRLN